jgi:hypothetical protein
MQQPFRDIGWMREEPPEILKRAQAKPYELADGVACDELNAEVAALDFLLGPDVDAFDVNSESSGNAGNLAADAVGSFIGLPFRGIFRWLSGADQREKALADAILSGVARRAFLKGVAHKAGCPTAPISQPPLT